MDPAAFYQVLSNAALNLASLRSPVHVPETFESMRHHLRAVQLVNKRITDSRAATADGLIGAVIGFACYSVRTASFTRDRTSAEDSIVLAYNWKPVWIPYAHERNQRDPPSPRGRRIP
jgi:hypothetical protein